MGVVNVTPDSFSDGGRYLDPDAAVRHGLALVAEGADLLDVGGESTRPGAEPVTDADELARVIPVVAALAAETAVPDQRRHHQGRRGRGGDRRGRVGRERHLGGPRRPAHARAWSARQAPASSRCTCRASRARCSTILTTTMSSPRSATSSSSDSRRHAPRGIAPDALCADPGIGFGKTAKHNLVLLARLSELVDRVEVPVLVGTSRKAFIGSVLGGASRGRA